jgi:hypothetical protein
MNINDPCPELELIKKYPKLFLSYIEVSVPYGWLKIVDDLLAKLDAVGGINVSQIKSKFARLRIYIDCEDIEAYDAAAKLIYQAEIASSVTCEFTGKEGAELYTTGGWLFTAHPDKAAEMKLTKFSWKE